jgi:catalase
MRMNHAHDPAYVPNSKGGPVADAQRFPDNAVWAADGAFVREAYTLRADDDDFAQANILINRVMDSAARDRLVSNIVGHVLQGVEEPVLSRVFEYWKNIDATIGQRVRDGVAAARD